MKAWVVTAWITLLALPLSAQQWPVYGGDDGGMKYSSLALINRANVLKLKVAWEWKSGEVPMPQFGAKPGPFEGTPIMLDGVLYFPSSYYRVIALDANSGRELWTYDPRAYQDGADPNTRYSHRGVAAWRDGSKLRIFLNVHQKLVCLDASTGKPLAGFGTNGEISLIHDLRWQVNPKHYSNSSPPVIYKDLVIVGSNVNDYMVYKKDPPGDVRAFDAHTGKLVWTFHTVPESNEPGAETWGGDSEKVTGHTNVWAPFTVDSVRGFVYLPVSTPSNDFYGGARPGKNLFAESIVCLDANTGKLKWFQQLVHHGLWDYDLPSPPNLVTITIGGKKIDAVVQLTKMGFIFVFERVTGKPVWPIEERPVPASDVPGEQAWPTQPFPTRPAPISDQGVTLNDAFDLTQELKLEAQTEMKKYRLGPLFTPPSLRGTLIRPGVIGGANWGGGAFDPETSTIYVKTSNNGGLARVIEPKRNAENDADYLMDRVSPASFHDDLPLFRPPYGYLTAINLNTSNIVWHEVFGDTPSVRNHPALKGVRLPEKLGVAGAQGVIVTRGGLVFAGCGDTAFHAVDKDTGRDLWTFALPRRVTATPMTYLGRNGRQYVVVATGTGTDADLMAFSL